MDFYFVSSPIIIYILKVLSYLFLIIIVIIVIIIVIDVFIIILYLFQTFLNLQHIDLLYNRNFF